MIDRARKVEQLDPSDWSGPEAELQEQGGKVRFLVHTHKGWERIYHQEISINADGRFDQEAGKNGTDLGPGDIFRVRLLPSTAGNCVVCILRCGDRLRKGHAQAGGGIALRDGLMQAQDCLFGLVDGDDVEGLGAVIVDAEVAGRARDIDLPWAVRVAELE